MAATDTGKSRVSVTIVTVAKRKFASKKDEYFNTYYHLKIELIG